MNSPRAVRSAGLARLRRSAGAARAAAAVLSALIAGACGKEGPPLPPLRPEPGQLSDVSAVRDGDRIEIRMQIPAANFDGTTPPVIERVEVYMAQTPAGAAAPGVTELLNAKHRVAVIPVRRADGKPPDPKTPDAVAGQPAVYVDAIDRSAAGVDTAATRHYLVVGATGRSRRGRPSPVLAIPVSGMPTPPAQIARKYDQTTMALSWTGQPGQQYRVYEATGPGAGANVTELTKEPIGTPEFSLPVWFGTERCFAVRAIAVTDRVSLVGPIGPGVCETPVDTFPPPAPSGLIAVQDERGIVLTWKGSDAPDLAGYRVLRGEGTGETLQQLLQDPTPETTFVDKGIVAGVTYVYTVTAVDKSGNVSGQSNREHITARVARN